AHAYFGLRGGTGGTGSARFPQLTTLQLGPTNFPVASPAFSAATAAGGGGGGYNGPGGIGSIPTPPPVNPAITVGPSNAGGAAFSLLPFPTNPPPNYSSLIHYLVGGSGGGGGGS